MTTSNMSAPEALTKEKLDAIDINVAEIDSQNPQMEFDKLTMRSPRMFPKPIVGQPVPHGNRPFSPDILVPTPVPRGNRPFSPDISIGQPGHGGFLRPSSPTGSVRSSYSSSRRRVSHHTHWTGGHSHSHRSEVSKELSLQAETEFLSLMELMSGISRRSSSLKEVWMKIISERDSYCTELDRLYERCEEYSETIETHRREQHSHNHEHEERKTEITKLKLELSAAISVSTGYKKKLADRETELGKCRSEIAELKDVHKYLREEHEKTSRTLEETKLELIAVRDKCHHAEQDAKKHRGEYESLDTKYVELTSRHEELKTKFASSHKEVATLKQTLTVIKNEKHEWLHEKGEIEERERRCHSRLDEMKSDLEELRTSYERKEHELRETTETLTKVRYEREESEKKVKEYKRKLHEKGCELDDVRDKCGKWQLKSEHYHRELTSITEELTTSKTEITRLEESFSKKTEELRVLVIEHKQLRKDLEGKCEESEGHHREILVLQEKLRRTEIEVTKKSEEIHSLHERIERIERDFEDAKSRCGNLEAERDTLTSTVLKLNIEIETVKKECDAIRGKLHQCEIEYEEHRSSYTGIHESHGAYDHEISGLRAMLREVREEREKAITMRVAADRERDEAQARYEAKCREADRLEERLHDCEYGHGHFGPGHGHHGPGHGHHGPGHGGHHGGVIRIPEIPHPGHGGGIRIPEVPPPTRGPVREPPFVGEPE
ncbi:hypothetical protein ACN47E_007146 [Coniothyrium glycines]